MKRPQPPALPLSTAALRGVERRGVSRRGLGDLYHSLMTVRLSALLGLLAGAFVVINIGFGALYWQIGGLAGTGARGFGGAFFFSVQTLSTTGYGATYPVSVAANIVSTAEILVGLLGTALATGVLFARLSRPRARVLFSNVAVIRRTKGTPTLMFRLVNERRNQIAEARIHVTVVRDEVGEDGETLRRMLSLRLERDVSPVFSLSWLVMHKITEDSPLHALIQPGGAGFVPGGAGFVIVCSLTGIDDTLNATIHARHVYGPEHLRPGHRFVDVIEFRDHRAFAIDYGKFHDVVLEEQQTQ